MHLLKDKYFKLDILIEWFHMSKCLLILTLDCVTLTVLTGHQISQERLWEFAVQIEEAVLNRIEHGPQISLPKIVGKLHITHIFLCGKL